MDQKAGRQKTLMAFSGKQFRETTSNQDKKGEKNEIEKFIFHTY